ncbi:hypothetical protein OC842_007736 [Tilletia horrida]|uniref:Uncharacterized protein n=1 Tax=Tilletia horrida TaxID=155126 RepID=A0AAN6G3B1_9BASI|nr:hypothetical protein OC842_007736 [Tilletia horrida]
MDSNLVYSGLAHVLAVIKPAGFGEWTHSATDLAHLVSLWETTNGGRRLQLDFIALAHGAASLYGLHYEPDLMDIGFDVARQIDAFGILGFVQPQPVEEIPNLQDYAGLGILPVGLRSRLFHEYRLTLTPKPYSDMILGPDHIRFELCDWHMDSSTMWAPAPHRNFARVHHFLKSAANLSFWAFHKAQFGQLWEALDYGAKFYAILQNDVDPSCVDEDHFIQWFSAGLEDGCHCVCRF